MSIRDQIFIGKYPHPVTGRRVKIYTGMDSQTRKQVYFVCSNGSPVIVAKPGSGERSPNKPKIPKTGKLEPKRRIAFPICLGRFENPRNQERFEVFTGKDRQTGKKVFFTSTNGTRRFVSTHEFCHFRAISRGEG